MEFEWNPRKAAMNRRKHNVSFEEAATVFSDPLAVTYYDPEHSVGEDRFLTFGFSGGSRLIVVAHVEGNKRIRIISARVATKHERQIYQDG
jgi:uncharacterized protein